MKYDQVNLAADWGGLEIIMTKNEFAPLPPMGWNSYDYYDTTVNEENIKANADYMAKYLKPYGWEYVVVDIEWYSYDAGTQRKRYQYIPFWKVEMDEYSRLLPCVDRFPSSKDGAGFKPLADYVHNLGLKFGIHIMRGIPRIAAHNHTPIYGTNYTANEIADPSSICFWNPDMYGVVPWAPGAQEYYNSLFELYASWGVDFVKCDDICRMDMPSAKQEIMMLQTAIQNCGRPIVLSLSPGPAKIEEAWFYEKYSNMWRITDDLWDRWPLIRNMFDRCELWQRHVTPGCYPDCDMLPLGMVGKGFGEERPCALTKEEQKTMMSLWCIFRSPLMLGCELPKLDDWTKDLITNPDVLNLLKLTEQARQIEKTEHYAVWTNNDPVSNCTYLALFNFKEEEQEITIDALSFEKASFNHVDFYELWEKTTLTGSGTTFAATIPAHGVKLYRCNL